MSPLAGGGRLTVLDAHARHSAPQPTGGQGRFQATALNYEVMPGTNNQECYGTFPSPTNAGDLLVAFTLLSANLTFENNFVMVEDGQASVPAVGIYPSCAGGISTVRPVYCSAGGTKGVAVEISGMKPSLAASTLGTATAMSAGQASVSLPVSGSYSVPKNSAVFLASFIEYNSTGIPPAPAGFSTVMDFPTMPGYVGAVYYGVATAAGVPSATLVFTTPSGSSVPLGAVLVGFAPA